MSVQSILREKGRSVITASGSVTVREACTLLHENHIGAIVVVDPDERIEGIFTERDVVGVISQRGGACLDEPLHAVMWKNVFCCSTEASINELMSMMNKHRARHLAVREGGRLVGIVSIGDVVRHHIRAIEFEAEYIRSYIAG